MTSRYKKTQVFRSPSGRLRQRLAACWCPGLAPLRPECTGGVARWSLLPAEPRKKAGVRSRKAACHAPRYPGTLPPQRPSSRDAFPGRLFGKSRRSLDQPIPRRCLGLRSASPAPPHLSASRSDALFVPQSTQNTRSRGRGTDPWKVSLHVERIDVEGELDTGGRPQQWLHLADQLVQFARADRLQLIVEAEVVLQPKHRRLSGPEQPHLRRLPSTRCCSRAS